MIQTFFLSFETTPQAIMEAEYKLTWRQADASSYHVEDGLPAAAPSHMPASSACLLAAHKTCR